MVTAIGVDNSTAGAAVPDLGYEPRRIAAPLL
jgi:hypothetical protein